MIHMLGGIQKSTLKNPKMPLSWLNIFQANLIFFTKVGSLAQGPTAKMKYLSSLMHRISSITISLGF